MEQIELVDGQEDLFKFKTFHKIKMSNLEEVREKIRNEINTNFLSRNEDFNNNFNINSNSYNKENLSDILSQLIRTTFIPKKNHRFIIADFSAIEARIIAYLSDEKWRIDVFNTHGKIYEASASKNILK